MAAAVFFGCAAIAFGPALALVLLTVAAEPLRVIVLVAGAFFWLVSLLLASLIWFILVHVSDREDPRLQRALLILGAAISVLLQELFRFAYFKVLKKADEGLVTISEDGRSPISLRQMAYGELWAGPGLPTAGMADPDPSHAAHAAFPALPLRSHLSLGSLMGCFGLDCCPCTVSGLSFGIISGIFSVINILADSMGPGIVGIHGDSPYYFITSAFLTMALVLLHTFWGIVFFDACERRRYWGLGLVVTSHLLTSGLTFLNPWYEASLVPIFIITLCTGLWAFVTAGGSFHNVLKCLSCKQEDDSTVMMYSALQVPCED
ncbi:gamma-secretase subunit APH-1A isoform 1-T1 [Ara ararauna]